MFTLKYAVITLYGLSLLAALTAAHWWWYSSQTSIDVSRVPPKAYVLGLQFERHFSSWHNSNAAIWTGIAAILAFIASVLSLFES
jgi:hypothetical protein